MKKFVPIAISILIATSAFAGTGQFAKIRRSGVIVVNPELINNVKSSVKEYSSSSLATARSKANSQQNIESYSRGHANTMLLSGDSVGYTWDDRETWNSMPKRCVNFGGGAGAFVSMGMVSNSFAQGTPSGDEEIYYSDNQGGGAPFLPINARGKTSWAPFTSGGHRAVSLADLPNDGPEVVVADGGDAFNTTALEYYIDLSALTGTWSSYTITGSTGAIQPCIAVTDSANQPIVHVIYAKYLESTPALFTDPAVLMYQSSRDSGKTWSTPIPVDSFVQAGAYAITANGQNLAIVDNQLGFLNVSLSSDNGNTATTLPPYIWIQHKSPLSSFPSYTGHDTTIFHDDTVFTWGNQFDAVMTPDGNVHIVAYPASTVIDSVIISGVFAGYYLEGGNYYYSEDSVDAVHYFNIADTVLYQGNYVLNVESVGPAEGKPNGTYDLNTLFTKTMDYTTFSLTEGWNIVSHPQIGFSLAEGNANKPVIYVVYSSFDQTDYVPYVFQGITDNVMYSHLYAATSATPNANSSWSSPNMLTDFSINDSYPSLSSDNSADNTFVLTYLQKNQPGDRTVTNSVIYQETGAGNSMFTPDYASAVIGFSGNASSLTPVSEPKQTLVPNGFALAPNYPNPVQGVTSLQYSLDSYANVSLKVYDMLGREVATLFNGAQSQGVHTTSFDASNLPSGVYTYTLSANGKTAMNTMIVSH